MPTVEEGAFSWSLGSEPCDVASAVEQLLRDGALSQLTEKELASLAKHRKLAGDFVVWARRSGGLMFLRVAAPAQVRTAAMARRESLLRALPSTEQAIDQNRPWVCRLEQCLQALEPIRRRIPDSMSGHFFLLRTSFWEAVAAVNQHGGPSPAEWTHFLEARGDGDFVRSFGTDAHSASAAGEAKAAGRPTPEWHRWCAAWVLHAGPKELARLRKLVADNDAQRRTAQAAIAELSDLIDSLKDEPEGASPDRRRREAIPKAVQREVWRRDQGRCVQCGSRERLCFDHVIPVAEGGSSTARNVQLLCERCNLTKGASI